MSLLRFYVTFLDSSHVSIEFQFIHTYMSLISFLVWRIKVAVRTGWRCMDEQKTYKTPYHVNRQTGKECAWGRPRLIQTVFEMLPFRYFVTCHERASAWLFHVGASQNYCVSHLSSWSNGGLTIKVSCVKDQPNMREGQRGEHLSSSLGTSVLYVCTYLTQGTPNIRCRVLRLSKPQRRG